MSSLVKASVASKETRQTGRIQEIDLDIISYFIDLCHVIWR